MKISRHFLLTLGPVLSATSFFSLSPFASATEFKPLAKALQEALHNPEKNQIFKKKYKADGADYDLYYSKGKDGKPNFFASVQKATYEKTCTHTWVVGLKAQPAPEVEKVHVVEMSCVDYTKSARTNSFLSQFEGKKVANLKNLDKEISAGSAAQSTYTGEYTIKAVQRTLSLASQYKP